MVETIKTTSFLLRHCIYDDKEELAAEAKDIIVIYDFNANQKMRITGDIRERMESQDRKRIGTRG